VPSLNRLDRNIRIWLSAGSSQAARAILDELGFNVELVAAGERITIGDLEIILFAPDHVDSDNGDEWDVLQFYVRDRCGDGSFFSAVDTEAVEKNLEELRSMAARPGLWCHTNNSTNWSFLLAGEVLKEKPPADTFVVAAQFIEEQSRLRFQWGTPAGALICGGGWCLAGPRARLNASVFHANSELIAHALSALAPGELFSAPLPGQTFHMSAGAVVGVDPSSPFLQAVDRREWPSRAYLGDTVLLETYCASVGRSEMNDDDLAVIEAGLKEFSTHLYGRRAFKGLYSLGRRELGRRKNAFALVLLANEEREAIVFEYRPQFCDFSLVESGDPAAEYVAGLECWGTDLAAALRGELSPSAIVFGGGRAWTYAPKLLPMDNFAIWDFFHPLRRSDRTLKLYRHVLAGEPATVPRIRASDGGA
jgi:hypothetical protein